MCIIQFDETCDTVLQSALCSSPSLTFVLNLTLGMSWE